MTSGDRRARWVAVLLLALVLTAWGHGQDASGQGLSQPERRSLPDVGRSPEDLQRTYEEIQAVVDRHQDELKQIPGVVAVNAVGDRISVAVVVHPDERGAKPTVPPLAVQAVPTTLEGIPVGIYTTYILAPPAGLVVVEPFAPDPQTEACPPESVRTWNTDHFECLAIAEACPAGFQETMRFDWRFCLSSSNPSLPDTMSPPIAGIPFAQVQAILERHRAEIMQWPGVTSSGLGAEGIVVGTDHPEAVPPSIEGVPVIVEPSRHLIGADLRGYDLPVRSGPPE